MSELVVLALDIALRRTGWAVGSFMGMGTAAATISP
jgi:hypothetical protein